jgi:hypothetical protein
MFCARIEHGVTLKKEHTGSNNVLEKTALNISPTVNYKVIRSRILRWEGNHFKETGTPRSRVSQKQGVRTWTVQV